MEATIFRRPFFVNSFPPSFAFDTLCKPFYIAELRGVDMRRKWKISHSLRSFEMTGYSHSPMGTEFRETTGSSREGVKGRSFGGFGYHQRLIL